MDTTRIARLERLARALVAAGDDTERSMRIYDTLDRAVARSGGSAQARAERDAFTDALEVARHEIKHTAIATPFVATHGDSSGDYAAMLTPGGTGFWESPDGIEVATWRDATDDEEVAIHYAGDDEATSYMRMDGTRYVAEDVLVFGALSDYGIASGDLLIACQALGRMVVITIQE